MRFRWIWNALLLVLCLALVAKSLPEIVAQTQAAARHSWELEFVTWLAEMTGLHLVVMLFLVTFGSCTWQEVGRSTRWFFAIATALLIIGDLIVAATVYYDIGFLFADYVTFALFALAISLPILVFRTGYIGLARTAWRWRNQRRRAA